MKQSISVNLPKLASHGVVGKRGENMAKLIVKRVGKVSLMDSTLLAQIALQKWKRNHQDDETGVAVGVESIENV